MPIAIPGTQGDQPLRKAVRRLRWFTRLFRAQLDETARETGNEYELDRVKLAEAFTAWLAAFNAQKPGREEDRRDYVGFAAGLMLRMLIEKAPVRLRTAPPDADPALPCHYWPEGYLYVAFCLNTRGLVLEHDFHGAQKPARELGDIRSWWSFRENVEEDPALAIAWLELFAGEEPDWTMPELFRSHRLRRLAGQFYHRELAPQAGPAAESAAGVSPDRSP